MGVSRGMACVLVLLAWTASAQDRYMVFFKDKTGTPHTVSSPQTFLSTRALDRRAKLQVAVNMDDLPVTPDYVTQIRGTGARAFFTTRWMNGVLIEASTSELASVVALPFVKSAEFVAPDPKLQGGRIGKAEEIEGASSGGVTTAQLSQLGMDVMHADGFKGENIRIAVMDTGFPGVNTAAAFQSLRSEGRIKMTKDFVTNSGDVYQFYQHGTNVLSVMTAEIDGIFYGGAPKADYLLFCTEDRNTEYRVEEYNWLFAAEAADSAGVDIIHTSLGYTTFTDPAMDYTYADMNGKTTVIARAANRARERNIILVISAGNEGGGPWNYIGSPADVEGILAVGATDLQGQVAVFSSRGPSSDNRIKPDVSALGIGTYVVRSDGSVGSASGTSVASPLVTSLVAGIHQAFPDVAMDDLLRAIRLTSSLGGNPDNNLGYGIPDYPTLKAFLSDQNQSWVNAFPNPASATCYLLFRGITNEQVELVFYDMCGREWHRSSGKVESEGNPLPVDLTSLPGGVYILRVSSPGRTAFFRIVKV